MQLGIEGRKRAGSLVRRAVREDECICEPIPGNLDVRGLPLNLAQSQLRDPVGCVRPSKNLTW